MVKRKANERVQKTRLELKMGPLKKVKANHKPPTISGKAKGTSKGTKKDTGTEQTFYSSADGKPVKKSLANVYKILSASTAKNWYEFNGANALYGSAGNGYYLLQATQSAAGQPLTLPCHIYDLSAVPNVVRGTTTQPTVGYCYTPSNETNTAYPSFATLGYSNSIFLQNTQGTTSNVESFPEAEDMHVSTQIKMNIFGALTVPMNVHVYIFKYKKDYLCPDIVNELPSQSSVEASTSYLSEAAAFYQSLLKPMLYNPILLQNQTHLKDITILKHDKFHFEPKLNTEATANEGGTATLWPHCKTVSYFERFNKKCDYSWSDIGSVALTQANATQVDAGQNATTVKPTERLYLMVVAEAFESPISGAAQTAFSNQRNASYDIMVRHKHERII